MVAFSPTDTMPLTRRAKAMMAVKSLVAVSTRSIDSRRSARRGGETKRAYGSAAISAPRFRFRPCEGFDRVLTAWRGSGIIGA